MTTPLTEERLVEIEARAKACFCAPWTAGNFVVECGCECEDCEGERDVQRLESPHEYPDGQVVADVYGLEMFAKPHAAFIANARQDVPDLTAEVRRLRALVAKLEWGSCDGCGKGNYCPICGGHKPGDRSYAHLSGHKDGCPVLGPPSPS